MSANGIAPAKGTGTGNGRNKTRAKQRDYKAHCRVMRTTGHITDADGRWFIPQGTDMRGRGTTEK